jgi:2-hydroxy-4-carboxymuconate semialdehyde hemiacetal dehydrogenase
MSALRVALMGYGAVADIHAQSIAARSDVEIVAVIGPRRDRALHFAARHGISQVFDELPRAVPAVHPDAVIIASPTDLHVPHAREAVESGVHALVEFPFVTEPAIARDLFGQAEKRGLVLAVAHTSRFIWSFKRARAIIHGGTLGECRAAQVVRLMDRPPGTGSSGALRSWTDDVLTHHAGHVLDIYRYWFGDQVKLIGSVSPDEEAGRRNVGLLLRGPGSCPLGGLLSYDARAPLLHARLIARNGDIEIDGFARLRVDGEEDREDDRPDSDEIGYQSAIRRQDSCFLDAIQAERKFPVPATEMIAVSDLIHHAQLSCREGGAAECHAGRSHGGACPGAEAPP